MLCAELRGALRTELGMNGMQSLGVFYIQSLGVCHPHPKVSLHRIWLSYPAWLWYLPVYAARLAGRLFSLEIHSRHEHMQGSVRAEQSFPLKKTSVFTRDSGEPEVAKFSSFTFWLQNSVRTAWQGLASRIRLVSLVFDICDPMHFNLIWPVKSIT